MACSLCQRVQNDLVSDKNNNKKKTTTQQIQSKDDDSPVTIAALLKSSPKHSEKQVLDSINGQQPPISCAKRAKIRCICNFLKEVVVDFDTHTWVSSGFVCCVYPQIDWSVQATVSLVLSETFGSQNISIIAEEDVKTLSKADSAGLLAAVVNTVNECLDEAP
ncbi:hypothetical protein TIFTF001_056049, partial [Ficus carica]